mmetsp:Transcript_94878/g.295441  ORF Transcript_94878/g.295441 Transcript_94878/m.295441 type:complete len:115 (+) Transcript_94878:167-511(+)
MWRLETIHACGFVHCDFSPEAIVVGRVREDAKDGGQRIFLSFFDRAQGHPEGRALAVDTGRLRRSSSERGSRASSSRKAVKMFRELLGFIRKNRSSKEAVRGDVKCSTERFSEC